MQPIPAPQPQDMTEKLVAQARKIVVDNQKGSISLVQRLMKCRYTEAALLLEELERRGVVGPMQPSGGRPVLLAT